MLVNGMMTTRMGGRSKASLLQACLSWPRHGSACGKQVMLNGRTGSQHSVEQLFGHSVRLVVAKFMGRQTVRTVLDGVYTLATIRVLDADDSARAAHAEASFHFLHMWIAAASFQT